jgi:hypothetical protein
MAGDNEHNASQSTVNGSLSHQAQGSQQKNKKDVTVSTMKKKKRKGPWDVKVGSVVAIRQNYCSRVVLVKRRKQQKNKKTESNDGSSSAPNEEVAAQHQHHQGDKYQEWLAPASHRVTWTSPGAGRDDGLALVGRLVRFLPDAILSNHKNAAQSKTTSPKAVAASTKKVIHDLDDNDEDLTPWIEGEVVAVQYPQSKEQHENKITVVGVLVNKAELEQQQNGEEMTRGNNNKSNSIQPQEKVAVQIKLQAIATCSRPIPWNVMRLAQALPDPNLSINSNTVSVVSASGAIPDNGTCMAMASANNFKEDAYYAGDGFDSAERQQANYRWIEKHKNDATKRGDHIHDNNNSMSHSNSTQHQPPIWHGEVVSMSMNETETDEVQRPTATLKRVWLPEETEEGRQEHHGADEVLDDVAKKKADTLFRVDLDHVIVVGRALARSRSSLDTIASLRQEQAAGAKNTSSRPPLFVTHSYSPKNHLYKPIVLPSPSIIIPPEPLAQAAATEMGQCHGCKRVYIIHISSLRTCEGGVCHGNYWCSSCSQSHKPPKAFSSSSSGTGIGDGNGDGDGNPISIWVGPCCVGGCDCSACLSSHVRSKVTAMLQQNIQRSVCLPSQWQKKTFALPTNANNDNNNTPSTASSICSTCLLPCAHSSVKCTQCGRESHKKCVKWEQAIAIRPPVPKDPKLVLVAAITSTGPPPSGKKQKNEYQCITCTYKHEHDKTDTSTNISTNSKKTSCKTKLFQALHHVVLTCCPMDFETSNAFLCPPIPVATPISKARQVGYGTSYTGRRDDASVGSGGTGLSRNRRRRDGTRNNSRKRKGQGEDSDDDGSQDEDPLESVLSELHVKDVVRGRGNGVGDDDNNNNNVIRKILVCSRTMSFDRENKRKVKYFAHHNALMGIVAPLNAALKTVHLSTRRNKREMSEFNAVDTDSNIAVGRAARAKQRRMVKDMGSCANMDLLAPNTLAGREPRLRFGRSQIHRWGIFAEESLGKGDMIVEYRGELISLPVANAREKQYELEKIGSDYMFRIDNKTVCDATKQGNMARFFNASCEANCMTKIIDVNNVKRVVVYALKDIPAGMELVYDYKFPVEYDESKRIPCLCGSKNCRGFLNWVSQVRAMVWCNAIFL